MVNKTEGMAKANGLSKPPNLQSTTWLVKQLATLAMARQANVDAETLKFFAVSLSGFLAEDLRLAIERLCHTKRHEGETAFPDLPTIEEAVETQRNLRMREEREVADQELRVQQAQHQAEHPEEYVTMAEIFAVVAARRAANGKPMSELLKPSTRTK